MKNIYPTYQYLRLKNYHSMLFFGILIAFCFLFSNKSWSQVLSNTAYKGIAKAQAAMSNDDYSNAIIELNLLLEKDKKLTDFDTAKALQLKAISLINLERIAEAITISEQTLSLQSLDNVSASQLRFTLFNLYSLEENYDKAIFHIEKWFASEEAPSVSSFFSSARVYALAEQWNDALRYAQQGMEALSNSQSANANNSEQSGSAVKPQNSWFSLLVAIQFQLKLFHDARDTLELAISLWPDNADFYRQLSGAYQSIDKQKEATAVLSLALQKNLLSSKNEFDSLSQQYRFLGYPFKATEILESAHKKNIYSDTENYWSTLSETFLHAREWDDANRCLTQAAKLSSTGKHWLTLCKTAFQNEKWNDSVKFCENALGKSQNKSTTSEAWQFIGLSKFRQDNLQGALQALNHCSTHDSGNKRCSDWITHISQTQTDNANEQSELARQKRLKEEKQNTLSEQLDRALLLDLDND